MAKNNDRIVITESGEQFVRRTIAATIYSSYVKYEQLQMLVYNTYSNSSIAMATKLNVFIDLYSVLHAIFSDKNRTIVEDYTDLVAGIINMCGHYRAFFRRLGVETKFYIIFSFNTCDINRKFVAEYNDEFWHKINDTDKYKNIAQNNFELLKVLCQYLPDIFFIESNKGFESSVVISHIIDKLHDGQPNLIISKDLYTIQLCTLHPYTSFLRPIKGKDYAGRPIDCSKMLPINEKYNYKREFWDMVASLRGVKVENFSDLDPSNFPLLMAMTKFPERNLHKSITGIVKASNAIRELGGIDMKILPSRLYEHPTISSEVPVAKVESIYNTLDIPFMRQYYDLDSESKNITFVNMRDDSVLQHINAKFFANNPLDFSRL